MDKILYFGGTMFITIITATGIFNLINDNSVIESINVLQIIIFHMLFLIIYLAHSYKRLISDVSYIFARTSDKYYQKRFNELLDNKYEFISIKNYFTKSGRILLKLFNYGIIVIYVIATTFPFVEFDFNDGAGIKFIGWEFTLTLFFFIMTLYIVFKVTNAGIFWGKAIFK